MSGSGGGPMRIWLAIVIGAALLAPGIASSQILSSDQAAEMQAMSAHPAECSRLRRQVDHFTTMHSRAASLQNALWSGRLKTHIETLRGIQAARCPQDLPVDTVAQAFKTMMQLAMKGAVTWFSMGAF